MITHVYGESKGAHHVDLHVFGRPPESLLAASRAPSALPEYGRGAYDVGNIVFDDGVSRADSGGAAGTQIQALHLALAAALRRDLAVASLRRIAESVNSRMGTIQGRSLHDRSPAIREVGELIEIAGALEEEETLDGSELGDLAEALEYVGVERTARATFQARLNRIGVKLTRMRKAADERGK